MPIAFDRHSLYLIVLPNFLIDQVATPDREKL